MSSLRVLTNLSMIPNLLPLLMCSSFATLVSNLISLSSQNFLIAALENSLSPVKPLICPTSSLNPWIVLTDTSALFSFLLFVSTYAQALRLNISTNNNIGISVSAFFHQNISIWNVCGGAVILYWYVLFTVVLIWLTSWFFKYSFISFILISGCLSLTFLINVVLLLIPNLLPFEICSSFATRVSNLILLSSQNF